MPEHIVRAFYYAAIHLTFASIVSLAALALTSVRRGSASAKYWIWTATSVNFFLPLGAILDRLWATHLSWARPLGIIGGEVNGILQNTTLAALLGVVWLLGATLMLVRLLRRMRAERRLTRAERPGFLADGVPVRFAVNGLGPEVAGILRPRISLPDGIGRLLSEPEIDAVLIHELTHAKKARQSDAPCLRSGSLCAVVSSAGLGGRISSRLVSGALLRRTRNSERLCGRLGFRTHETGQSGSARDHYIVVLKPSTGTVGCRSAATNVPDAEYFNDRAVRGCVPGGRF